MSEVLGLRLHRRRCPFALAALVLSACGSAPPAGHQHLTAATVTVTETALEPSAEVRIPPFATVVFRNGRAQGAVDVQLARDLGTCRGCSTTLRFLAEDHAAVARDLPPGAFATICFHDVGRFPFVVRDGGSERRGTVIVGGAP